MATTTRPDGSGAMFYDVGGSQISATSNGVTTTSTMAPQYVKNDSVGRIDPRGLQDCVADFCITATDLFPDDLGDGGGSGGVRSLKPAPADPTDPVGKFGQLPSDCQTGLSTAITGPDNAATDNVRLAALTLASREKGSLQKAASQHGLDSRVLAAIGINESKFGIDSNAFSGANGNYGIFQINLAGNNLTLSQAKSMSFESQAKVAANILFTGETKFSQQGGAGEYGFDSIALALAYYDGVASSKILDAILSGNPNTLDRST